MMLNDIQDSLMRIDRNVYYGTAAKLPKDAPWDYIVFSRKALSRSQGRTGLTDSVEVAIVREEYIPDGLAEEVIAAMESIPGIRMSQDGGSYVYSVKPGTAVTCEMLVLSFSKARRT